MEKSTHQVNIVKIKELLPHNNADSLELIQIDGYQVVVKKGQFKVGDLAVYIPPDSVVPQIEPFRFIWGQYETINTDPNKKPTLADPACLVADIPERRRRITVRKFRGEWSEGLLMPLSDFIVPNVTCANPDGWNEDDDVAEKIGITHYDPDAGKENTYGSSSAGPRFRYPRTLRGWFYFILWKLGFKGVRSLHEEVGFSLPVYDIDAFKRYKHVLQDGELVSITEKIHGSNARFVFLDGRMFVGSHNFWKAPESNCVWRKCLKQNPWIEEWCREHEGYALYGEVVPTQKGFDYGCKKDEVRLFVFDIRTPDGRWATQWQAGTAVIGELTQLWGSVPHEHKVPLLSLCKYSPANVQMFVDGDSRVPGAQHEREGVVVRPFSERRVPGLGRVILKVISNAFFAKDSK